MAEHKPHWHHEEGTKNRAWHVSLERWLVKIADIEGVTRLTRADFLPTVSMLG